MILKRIVLPAVLTLSAILTPVFSSAVAATQLAPHKAIYAVTLNPESKGGMVVDVDGVMSMSLEKTCNGWIFAQDMKTVISVDSGHAVNQSALFTSWESLDGREYRFASHVKTGDGQLVMRGEAQLNPDGTGSATYREPEAVEISLPAETMFPVSHTAWLISEAKAGKRSAPRIVFTGSEELEAELVNAFIGDYVAATDHAGAELGGLAAEGGWPLIMAFYPLASQTGIPSFEMRALQLENGVSQELQMNFGDFSTTLTLQRLEVIEYPSCS